MTCPHCKAPLTPEQIRALWGAYTSSKRTVKTGGRNGGRPKAKKGEGK